MLHRLVFSTLLLLSFLGITSATPALLYPGALTCTEQLRNGEVCFTYNYVPSMGFTRNLEYKVYANECEACKDPDVEYYWNFNLCLPDMIIGSLRSPYCVLTMDNKLIQFDNLKEACDNESTNFFLGGMCPRI